jgi:hypothetical protein
MQILLNFYANLASVFFTGKWNFLKIYRVNKNFKFIDFKLFFIFSVLHFWKIIIFLLLNKVVSDFLCYKLWTITITFPKHKFSFQFLQFSGKTKGKLVCGIGSCRNF